MLMLAKAGLSAGLSLARGLPWGRMLLAAAPAALVVIFWVWPLRSETARLETVLANRTTDLLDAREMLSAEQSARQQASIYVLTAARQNAELAADLATARRAANAAVTETETRILEEIRHARTEWSSRPVPRRDAWRLCVNAAAIAGVDHTACGHPAEPDD